MQGLQLAYPMSELADVPEAERRRRLCLAFAYNMLTLGKWEIIEEYNEQYNCKTIIIQEVVEPNAKKDT